MIDLKDIRVLGTKEEPYFVARDVAKILGYKDTDQALRKHVDEEDKITYKEYLEKNICNKIKISTQAILINKRGVICLLTYGRKNNEILLRWLKDNFEIDYNIIKRLSKEEEYIGIIMKVFNGEEMIRQYKIEDYRVDLYFPKYNLIIECDEFGHSDRDKEYENKRSRDIKKKLKSTFIRFNPDEINFDIFKTINEIFNYIKGQL